MIAALIGFESGAFFWIVAIGSFVLGYATRSFVMAWRQVTRDIRNLDEMARRRGPGSSPRALP